MNNVEGKLFEVREMKKANGEEWLFHKFWAIFDMTKGKQVSCQYAKKFEAELRCKSLNAKRAI